MRCCDVGIIDIRLVDLADGLEVGWVGKEAIVIKVHVVCVGVTKWFSVIDLIASSCSGPLRVKLTLGWDQDSGGYVGFSTTGEHVGMSGLLSLRFRQVGTVVGTVRSVGVLRLLSASGVITDVTSIH